MAKELKTEKLGVVKAALRVVKLSQVQVDTSYQREVKKKHARIIADFNPDALGIPVIAEREDGTLWIVDGLQRITALRKMGRTEVRAEVFRSEGSEHEAKIFTIINLNRTKLTVLEEFKALLSAHDTKAWELKEAVESVGYKIAGKAVSTSNRCAKNLTCVNFLQEVQKSSGTDPIKFALRMIDQSWPGDPLGINIAVVAGLCRFFTRMEGAVEESRLLTRLRTTTPQKIIYTLQQTALGGSRWEVAGDIITRIYKKRLATSR